MIKHINAIVTYDSDFVMSEVMGSYTVEKPELLKIEDLGAWLFPLAEGETDITFTTSTGLTAKGTITIVE